MAGEVRCAVNLAALLRRFDSSDGGYDGTAFREALEEEARAMAEAPYGEALCRVLGFTYINKADQWKGFNNSSVYYHHQDQDHEGSGSDSSSPEESGPSASASASASASTAPSSSASSSPVASSSSPPSSSPSSAVVVTSSARGVPSLQEQWEGVARAVSGGWAGHAAKMEQRVETAQHYLSTAGALFDTVAAGCSVGEAQRSSKTADPWGVPEEDEEARRAARVHEQMEASLPSALAAAWAITTLDVQKTLRHVCDKVLEDGGVSQPTTSMQL